MFDVDGPLTVPGGIQAVIPDPLQVGRLGAGPTAGNQQKAAELEIERHQIGIVGFFRLPEPCIGRLLIGIMPAKIQGNPTEEVLMIFHVGMMKGFVGFILDGLDNALALCSGITINTQVRLMVGGGGEDQRDGIRLVDF